MPQHAGNSLRQGCQFYHWHYLNGTIFRQRGKAPDNPMPLLLFFLPLHVMSLLLEGFLLTTIKRNISIFNSIYWNCIKTLWKERSALLHMRYMVQKSRKISLRVFCSTFILLPHKFHLLIKYGVPEIR